MKKTLILTVFILVYTSGFSQFFEDDSGVNKQKGYFDIYYKKKADKLFMVVDKLQTEFLYVSALSEGLGSNDIGLDRGQLRGGRVVYFEKRGNKLVLIQPNMRYRANSDNDAEQNSIREAFAKSVLFGFPIVKSYQDAYLIDITNFVIRDDHGVQTLLKNQGQGNFSMDKSRSFLNLDRTKAFPENVEFDAYLTFVGVVSGSNLASVNPDRNSVTVAQHHSFVKLPDAGYQPRKFDPRSGSFYSTYMDYASPVDEPIRKHFINRHRLIKKNPGDSKSLAKEPIIYYLDPGTPEPVRSALLEGASWWNEAFEAAGFQDAFQVKILPEGADPLDTRFNVIQWVHRSTRGWSYGASITDPRTGEIIKGHVSLGSLRIRQDYLIGKSLTSDSNQAMEMALARIRQLSAHEVGHTLGFAHNFAASSNNRASVMDYPHPMIRLKGDTISLADAYAVGIGEWDKIATRYAYSDATEEDLDKMLIQANKDGFRFISDADARAKSGAHAYAHLWDNGEDAITEMEEVIKVRKKAMDSFSIDAIETGQNYSELEDAFVPVYFFHRYQTEAIVKLVGGLDYSYQIKGGEQSDMKVLNKQVQQTAVNALLLTIKPDFLTIPERLLKVFPPRVYGYDQTRESFRGFTGRSFDAIAPGVTSANFTLDLLLNEQRLTRLLYQGGTEENYKLEDLFSDILTQTIFKEITDLDLIEMRNSVNFVLMDHFYRLALYAETPQLQAYAWNAIHRVERFLEKSKAKGKQKIYNQKILKDIQQVQLKGMAYKFIPIAKIPDGSPI